MRSSKPKTVMTLIFTAGMHVSASPAPRAPRRWPGCSAARRLGRKPGRQATLSVAICCALALTLGPARRVWAQAEEATTSDGCGPGGAFEALASHGPLNEYGYPSYYMDLGGLPLDLCDETTDEDPLCGNPPFGDPTGEGLPFDAPPDIVSGNFWHEVFYFLALANITFTGGDALIVLAIEGVWDNEAEAINDGDQLVFSRIRHRISVPNLPSSAGTYTVTHPYGVDTFEVTEADIAATQGTRAINFTDDCLHTVVGGVITPSCGVAIGDHFTNPLDPTRSRISDFLTWDEGADEGYIGDPAALNPVIGSPCGTNFFRVEGPGVPGGSIETTLFNLQGRIASICGDGFVDPDAGEECDDGNTIDGDCCASDCLFETALTPCDDGNLCTNNTTCDGAGLCQVDTINVGLECDDGNACTTLDACDAPGECIGGPPPSCDDTDTCTDDSCDPLSGCVNAFNTLPCDDGDACTTDDTCDGSGTCEGGPPPNCDDSEQCTDDSCDSVDGCVNTPTDDPCDDGDACTTDDTCDGAGTCVGGPPPDCDDEDQCTADSCDSVDGCVSTPTEDPCDDGDACTTDDTCDGAGACIGGPPPNCNDNNGCTADSCDPESGCVNANVSIPCDDGNACTNGDTCSGGGCVPGPPLVCDDQNVCTTDSCNASSGCANTPTTDPCNDGNACTTNDACNGAGACVGGDPPNCDDGNVCTDDACDPGSGCSNLANSEPCDDGNACTTNDACASTSCVGGPQRDCNDQNDCTTNSCNPATGCETVNVSGPCDDGDACTSGDACSAGECLSGAAVSCDDENLCTDDSCNPQSGCANTHNAAPCDDENACTTGDTCSGGACAGGPPLACDDQNECTDDSCDPQSGCVTSDNSAPCSDGNPTTQGDSCSAGACAAGVLGCPDQPLAQCRVPVVAGKSLLVLADGSPDGSPHAKDKAKWVWKKGEETTKEDFGDPVAGSTDYLFCLYDGAGGSMQTLLGAAIAPGSGWKPKATGYAYKNKLAQSGIVKLQLKPGRDGKAVIKVIGKGANLGGMALPLTLDPEATAQMVSPTGCWEANYANAAVNTAAKLKAKGGP